MKYLYFSPILSDSTLFLFQYNSNFCKLENPRPILIFTFFFFFPFHEHAIKPVQMFRIRIFSHSPSPPPPSVTGDNDRWRAVNRSDIDFLNLAAVKRFERMISRSAYPRFRNDGRTMVDALSVGRDRHCPIPDNKRDKRKLPVERGTDLNG